VLARPENTYQGLFVERQARVYQGGALAYALAGYVLGLVGLFHTSFLVNLGATVLLAHAMIIAAYLIHECAHNSIFRKMRHNALLGRFLGWVCGASYGRYEDIRYKHFRHHIDNADVVWFDYEDFFAKHPRVLAATRFLEWFYIPAHDLIMHFVLAFNAFIIPERRNQRLRNAAIIVIRGGLFAVLAIYQPRAAILYVIAYLMMMTVLRFMDSLQHDYGYDLTLYEPQNAPRKGDHGWEQEHTFSNPVSFRLAWPNWLVLNFGYHNAHHARMDVPWYRLPGLHRELFGDSPENVIPLRAQLRVFHRQRVRRIVGNHSDDAPWGREYLVAARQARVYGGNAASFLTSF
jgi:fatty acid desaturase